MIVTQIVASRNPVRRHFFVWAISIVLCGCFESKPAPALKTVVAGGTVTYRGQPVSGAEVTFHNENPADSAFGLTNARGEFRCMTNEAGEGIPPGDYTVSVSKPKGGIPPRYADPESTPLSITVEEGEANQFKFELID